jgi:hypothetical protein
MMVLAEVTPFAEKIGVPLLVAVIGLIGAVGTAALAFALGRVSEASARRRDGYAAATKELLAWAEYPYRLKRRTSDDAASMTKLADLGHELQEALRYREAWIQAENRWVATVFAEVRKELGKTVGPACSDAWASAPVTTAAGMNLNGWGPTDTDALLQRFERALRFRFGWRRWVALFRWHPGA